MTSTPDFDHVERSRRENDIFDDMRAFKVILRVLGFWHPRDASFLESWVYPAIVNLIFFTMFVLETVYLATAYPQALKLAKNEKNYDQLFDLSVRLTVDLYAWLCHVFTVAYFKCRDLESNLLQVINFDVDLILRCLTLNRRLKFILLVSFIINLLVNVLTLYNTFWLDTNLKSNATNMEFLVFGMNYLYIPFNIYLIPVSLSLTVVMYLLYGISKLRLVHFRRTFLQWEYSAEDAIYYHYTEYSIKVHRTCTKLKWLFIVHNAIMIVLTPMFCYLSMEIVKKQNSFHFAIFILLCTETVVSWIVPLLFAEGLASQENQFREDVNKFCPGYFRDVTPGIDGEALERKTFTSRGEVNKLLSYLRERKLGFVIGAYSFQLKLSMWSFYFGFILFVIKVFI